MHFHCTHLRKEGRVVVVTEAQIFLSPFTHVLLLIRLATTSSSVSFKDSTEKKKKKKLQQFWTSLFIINKTYEKSITRTWWLHSTLIHYVDQPLKIKTKFFAYYTKKSSHPNSSRPLMPCGSGRFSDYWTPQIIANLDTYLVLSFIKMGTLFIYLISI